MPIVSIALLFSGRERELELCGTCAFTSNGSPSLLCGELGLVTQLAAASFERSAVFHPVDADLGCASLVVKPFDRCAISLRVPDPGHVYL